MTTTRVRALLRTPSGGLLLIRRTRPGAPPYWVFPGGGVEATDSSLQDALVREVFEELAGTAVVGRLVYILERSVGPGRVERELYFLATIDRWSASERTGPEFARPGSGSYDCDEVPLTRAEVESRQIKPVQVAQFLLAHCEALDELPALAAGW